MADPRVAKIERWFKDLSGQTLIDEALEAGLEVAAACALISKETGGRNIFGADYGVLGKDAIPFAHLPVTRRRVDALIRHVQRGGTSNGIGVSQLTSKEFIFAAEREGDVTVPRYQMRVGFELLAHLIRQFGDDPNAFQKGAAAYNAGLGNWRAVYDTYGANVVRLYGLWKEEFEGARDPVVKRRTRAQTGLATMRQYLGAHYATWRPGTDEFGPPLYTDGVPTPEEARRGGMICATVPVIYRLANGLGLPPMRGVLKGGTYYWGLLHDTEANRYVPGKRYPAGTLFGSPFKGSALKDQGHVAVSSEAGTNPRLMQALAYSDSVNEKYRLNDMARFKYAVPPRRWLG